MIEEETATDSRPTASPTTRRLGLTFDHLLIIAVALVPALVVLRSSMATVDLAYQIRAGEIMLRSGHVLRVDRFTFTAFGRQWLDQQWGAQIVLAQLYRTAGWAGIAIAQAVIASWSIGLVFLACRARGASVRSAAWLSLGGLLVAVYGFSPRPQMFAFLLFAATVAIVAVRGRNPRLLWLVAALTVIWANVHGSFVLAPVLLGLAWLEDRRKGSASARTALLAAIASVLAVTVNPFGLRVWSYVVSLSTNPQIRRTIEEWQPPRPLTFTGFVFFASVIGVGIVALRNRGRLGWPRLVALALFALIGISAVRGIIWWSLAAPVLIADLFPVRSARRDPPRVLNAGIVAALILVGVAYLPWSRPMFTSTANSGTVTDGLLAFAPARYTATLAERVPEGARVFAPESWASWFEFAAPADPVMVDPRIELFPSSVWDDYDRISAAGPGWQRTLDRWGVDVLALSRKDQPRLIGAVARSDEWTPLYRDADGVLLVRSP
jgi:hypothetical protein